MLKIQVLNIKGLVKNTKRSFISGFGLLLMVCFSVQFVMADNGRATKTIFIKGGVHYVADYGKIYEGADLPDSLSRKNSALIQFVVDHVGEAGGGTVVLPEGIFCLYGEPRDWCIKIRHDNITLRGQGMYKTIIRTRNDWDDGLKARTGGIRIVGTKDKAYPRRNITLMDFELDGGAGWTGKYRWQIKLPDEWDISHKGIITTKDEYVDQITLKNLYVHRYRGEILYSAGMLSGRVVVKGCKMGDTNGSCFNLYGSELLVDSTEMSGPSRFWVELLARPNQAGYPADRVEFTNCVFKDAVGAQGIAICQGDNRPLSFLFRNNIFMNSPRGLFLFAGGIAGPVLITENKITNCGGDTTKGAGSLLDFEFGGNTENPKNNHWVKNITFTNNTVISPGVFIDLKGSWDGIPMVVENVTIRDNYFSGTDSISVCEAKSVIYGESIAWYNKSVNNCQMSNIAITNNVFRNCAAPKQIGKILGTRPQFKNNTYINSCKDSEF
jgi:hypothetical protein